MKVFRSGAFAPSLAVSFTLSLMLTTHYFHARGYPFPEAFLPVDASQNEQIVDKICTVILRYALTRDIDAQNVSVASKFPNQKGIPDLKKKIRDLIKESQPLPFTLVGFPFKSGNKQKNVIGALPDQAERLALETLQRFMEEIHKVYKPGAHLIIYTDGLAFCDLLGISLDEVARYEQTLKKLAANLPSLSIVTCKDLFPNLSPQEIQTYIRNQKIPLKRLTATGKNVLSKRLLKELDYPEGKILLEKNPLATLAEEMDQRSQKINSLYKSKFPEAIRLSVHYQNDLGQKVGISLVPGLITPWHGVAALNKDGSFVVKQKHDLPKESRLSSKEINGVICYYYIN